MSNVGFRIYSKITRPSRERVELLRGLPVATIDDCMNRLFCLTGLKPFNKVPMLGTAFTVKVPAGENNLFNRAIDLAEPGDILVVDGGASLERALCGSIMINHAKSRGLAGFVINGAVRDVDEIAEIDFPVYALGFNPNGPLKNGKGEINVPVVAGGMAVMPGDVLVGDGDGIVLVRPGDIEDVVEKTKKAVAGEAHVKEMIRNKSWDRSNFIKILADEGCEIIDD